MTITLPSKYTGGELRVSFDGDEKTFDSSHTSATNNLFISAFYADCTHEIKPLISGYRICLVYNLIHTNFLRKVELPSAKKHVKQFRALLEKQIATTNSNPIIILLGHQYTPENFSLEGLKLNDRYKADILLQAANEVNCYSKMCLVTSYKIGTPVYNHYYDDDDIDESTEIDEVIDESLSIQHWIKNDFPSFGEIGFEESFLIAGFELDKDEPLIKENSGYMGNYGPDIEHWYHYGAIMIWTKETNAQLILTQNTKIKLDWIDYFSKNLNSIDQSEKEVVQELAMNGLYHSNTQEKVNYDPLVNWAINRKDQTFFSNLAPEICRYCFINITANKWVEFLQFLPESSANLLIDSILKDLNSKEFQKILDILNNMLNKGTLEELVLKYIRKIPEYLETIASKKIEILIDKPALENLFEIANNTIQNIDWINNISTTLLKCTNRNYLNLVLVPALLETKLKSELTFKTLRNCQNHYQNISKLKPFPPKDWSRKLPNYQSHKRQWDILKSFLESPTEQVFEFRTNQSERSAMENALFDVIIDLKTETIKRGRRIHF